MKKVIIPQSYKSRVAKSRCSVSLFVSQAYLEGLYTNALDLLNDSEYSAAFNALRNRLSDMFNSVGDSARDILDFYCVVKRGALNG